MSSGCSLVLAMVERVESDCRRVWTGVFCTDNSLITAGNIWGGEGCLEDEPTDLWEPKFSLQVITYFVQYKVFSVSLFLLDVSQLKCLYDKMYRPQSFKVEKLQLCIKYLIVCRPCSPSEIMTLILEGCECNRLFCFSLLFS